MDHRSDLGRRAGEDDVAILNLAAMDVQPAVANGGDVAGVAQAKADNLSTPGLSTAGLPPFLIGPATGLNGALNSILRAKNVSDTISVGVRWDFFKSLDLKLQYDHTRIGAGSTGALANVQPGFQTGSTFNLISATVDFVF